MESSTAITSVEVILLDVPTIRPHLLSVAAMRQQTLVLVVVKANDDIAGYGEATTIGGLRYGGESPESIKINIDTHITPLLIGRKANDVAGAMRAIRTTVQDNRFAKCAIETALFDAYAKRLGIPLSELFGGRVRDKLPVAWTLASGNTVQDIAEAEKMLDLRRHRIFKLKIGAHPVDKDVAHVAAIKRAIGERGSVRVDVNQAWSETDAVRGMAMLEAAGVDLVEQPIAAGNHAGMCRLRSKCMVPLMADEALHGPKDAFSLASQRAADVFAVKITQSGGLTGAMHVAAIAEAAHIDLYGGTMLEGGIGTIASAHIFSCFASLAWGTELFGPLLLTEELLSTPLLYEDFHLHVPTAPGLGVSVDEDRIAFMRRDRTAPKVFAVP
jgi:muconate cycloisomerase